MPRSSGSEDTNDATESYCRRRQRSKKKKKKKTFARLHYVIVNTFANSYDPLSNDGIILQDWNDLAQKQREDFDCGLHVDQKYECSKCNASFT